MRSLLKFRADQRGLAAMEFALIAPILVGLLVLGADGFIRTSQMSDMRSALNAGARYYEVGGSDDAAAQTFATNAWSHKPSDAALTVARACYCGSTAIACTSLCPNSDPPTVFITLRTTGTAPGLMQSHVLAQNQVIRVR